MTADPVPIPAALAMDDEPFDDEDVEVVADLLAAHNGATFAALLAYGPTEELPAPLGDAPVAVVRWRVTDDGKAEWAMRKLIAAEDERAELEARRRDWTERIDAWFKTATRDADRRIGFFTAHLEDYGLRCREANPKKATIPLPSGKIATTYRQPRVEVVDEEAFIAWARENAKALVRVKEEPKVNEIRQATKVVDVADGVWALLHAEPCGHDTKIVLAVEEGAEPPEPGEVLGWVVRCRTCEATPDRMIAAQVWPRFVPAVALAGTDQLVPGLALGDGTLTATPKPDRG